jgi:membrane-associated protein
MHWILTAINFVLHVDVYLTQIIHTYGSWTYGLLFFVIFMETGFVVTPFLPGDSLIFAAATFAARGALNPWVLYLIFITAAVGGDNTNYWIGHAIGARAYTGEVKWIKQEYMQRTHTFFEKHGGSTIFLARFVPIIRTFTPFVAGAGEMSYRYFLTWDVIGGLSWVATFLLAGFFFGNIPFVQKNFELVILAIVLISFVPAVSQALRMRRAGKEPKQATNA